MNHLIENLRYDKSIWLYPNGFCLVEGEGSSRQQFCYYADGDILSVKAMEFFKIPATATVDVEVLVANEPPVIVPKELYQSEESLKFIALQYDAAKVTQTFACDMDQYKLLFFLYKNEQNALDRLSFSKHFVSYWEMVQRGVRQQEHPQNLIWVAEYDSYLDFYVEKRGEIVLLNRFNYKTAEDELYFIMNLKQQFHLGDAAVWINSDSHRSPLKSLAKKYLDNYSWID